MSAISNLIGHRFGKLTVVGFHSTQNGKSKWSCVCDCGGTTVSFATGLKRGVATSCGCSRKTHGLSKTPEYIVWKGIMGRCLNPSDGSFIYYGGCGIKVCDRWRCSFENFISDMGKRPTRLHTIERKNNDGNYEPNNCAWATRKQQLENRRPRSEWLNNRFKAARCISMGEHNLGTMNRISDEAMKKEQ